MLIRPATTADHAAIADVIHTVIRAGETYALDPAMTRAEALSYWFASDKEVWLAQGERGEVMGTYYLRANQAGGGAHVANCGYMTAAAASGRGVAGALCDHSLDRARARGFLAMQFNFVVASNVRAVALWQRKGFAIVGRVPLAFRHPALGLVDALVMHRAL